MPSENESTPANIFDPTFLAALKLRDETHTTEEAEYAGPWTVRDTVGGFGVFRDSDGDAASPQAVFEHREHALLLAAVLPGVGREPLFHVEEKAGPGGHAVHAVWGEAWSRPVGRLRYHEPQVIEAMHLAEALVRSPAALAWLLEAAGSTALELAGEILARRLEDGGE